MPIKFCRSTLFEAGRALFMANWKIYLRKTSMVLTVKAVLKTTWRTRVSQNGCEVCCAACDSWQLHEENQLWFNNSKHFRFYWTKKCFIWEWYFTENHKIGSVVVRKVKKSWDSGKNRELGPATGSQRAIFYCWSFHHVYCLDEWPWSRDSCKMYKIRTSWKGNDLWQLSFWYRALSCRADWFTKGVYIWVTHLHIAVPTITCSLRYA